MPRKVLPKPHELGRMYVNLTISNFADPSRSIDTEALIDTGALHLTLPAAWRPRLGELETLQRFTAELASGEQVPAEICGPVRLEIEGQRPIFTEVMFIDMIPSDGVYEPLLGHLPLQAIPVVIDLKTHTLVAVSADLK